MKHWMLFLLMVLGSARTFAQQGYFIYLQTENHQPFYVRMGEKVYSSTASGYLIIPQLSDTSYQLVAGFPGNAFPEQYFNTDIRHKDAGYLLKNFGDKGWGLFNLQSLAVIMNSNASAEKKNPEVSVTKKTDAFSTLLANAVNDTSILYTTRLLEPAPAKTIAKAEPVKDTTITHPEPAKPATDTAIVAKTAPATVDTTATAAIAPPAIDSALVSKIEQAATTNTTQKDTLPAAITKEAPAAITTAEKTNTLKVAELLTDTSYIAVFTDGTTEKYDTVRISIPLDKPGVLIQEAPRNGRQPVYNMPDTAAQAVTDTPKEPVQTQKDTAKKTVTPVTVAPTTEQKPVPQELRLPTEEPQKPEAPKKDTVVRRDVATALTDTAHAQETTTKPVIPNSDCKNLAWDSEIDKLRIKMLAVKTDDDRIILAKKLFKQKCLLVKQVRALSELFNSDEGKYKWFDASYPSVSDTANFHQLGELIKDNYYQSRFKAMLRH